METSLTPELLVPRLGEYLVKTGTITIADLKKGLEFQAGVERDGTRCLLGQALLQLGLIERGQLDHAITEQIIQLRNALEDSNQHLELRVKERTVELQHALQELSELNRMKANFVANISHELRTPLTHIMGYLELLLSESLGVLTAGQANALRVSQTSADKLDALINNLILFSQAEHGTITLQLSRVDITELARKAINIFTEKAADQNITLETDLPTILGEVQVDAEKISWVFQQLLGNALKFTPSGGLVRFSIWPEAGRLIMISVRDTGIGIPEARINEIFEPFHQLDGSPTRRYGGTGLGLALVRDILNAHGSIIKVESEEGKGSEFTFPLLAMESTQDGLD